MDRPPFLLKPVFAQALAAWHRALQGFSVRVVAVYSPADLVLTHGGAKEQTSLLGVWPLDQPPLASNLHELTRPIARRFTSLLEVCSLAEHADLSDWQFGGLRSFVRVSIPVAGGHGVDLFHFFDVPKEEADFAGVTAAALAHWPFLRDGLVAQMSPLTSREVKCLAHAFGGLTARETAELMGVSERTINADLQSAIDKLCVNNKLAAVQRACWLGHF